MNLLVDKLLSFSFDLYDTLLAKSNSSFVFSPFIMFKILGILLNAAEGETKEYLQSLLYKNADIANINQKIKILDQAVTIPLNFQIFKYFDEQKNNGCIFKNFIYYNNKYNMRSSFSETMENSFGIIPEPVDLQNPEEVLERINKCVSDSTNGYIPNFLKKLDRNLNTMIISTIFFKGSWYKKFSENTRDEKFYYKNGTSSVVPMMTINEEFTALNNEKYKAIQLYYKQAGFSFLAVMPKKNQKLSKVSNDIFEMGFNKFISTMERYEVDLKMPKFKIETELDFFSIKNEKLNKVFSKLNDLTMLENKTSQEVQLLQKAIIDVDEKGTVAAAAAGYVVTDGMRQQIRNVSITFNEPFLYFIIKYCKKNHEEFYIPIFMGQYYGN